MDSMTLPGAIHMWHPRVHQRWADEELTFWRLAFFPAYRRDRIVAGINAVIEEHSIGSYVIYETLGAYDLFVSTWLPAQVAEQFERALADALSSEALQLLEPFAVSRHLRHWVWDDGHGGLREPTADVLARPWDEGAIARANRGELSREEKQEFDERNVLAQTATPSDGTRVSFLVAVSSAPYSLAVGTRGELAKRLAELLDEDGIEAGALYEGSGFALYVLTGNVAGTDFGVIARFSEAVNALAEDESLTARPYTHISMDVVDYADSLRVAEGVRLVDLEELLSSRDSHNVAVEPSLRLDWQNWLENDADPPTFQDRILDDGLIKTVVGMLNSDGGRVVVGALAGDTPLESGLARDHGKLEKLPRIDGDICLGVNFEFGEDGWEGLQLQLRDWFSAKIDPAPIGAYSIVKHSIGDVDMCVIHIEPRRSTWYYRYLGPTEPVKFYVREEGRTVAYVGSTADAYKRSQPRGRL